MKHDRCPTCDASMREYRHPLASQSMIRVIDALYEQAGLEPARITELKGLRIGDAASGNWMKAAYWGLISSVAPRSGEWRITELGERFLNNREALPATAIVYRNKVLRFEGTPILRRDLTFGRQKTRDDYIADSMPHGAVV